MNHKILSLVFAFGLTVLIAACTKEDEPDYIPVQPYASGAFISNEGTFGLANSSVSFYSYSGDSITNDIYTKVNNRPLGMVLQSIHLAAGKAYLVLNLSDTVVVVNSGDFKVSGNITGLSSPRYMATYNGKGFITQWGAGGAVKVVDLNTNAILHTEKVGTGPEQAIFAANNILVCNGGGFDRDSTVSVINPASYRVSKTIVVGDNPKEMVVDKNNDIWVLCYGYIKYDSNFSIVLETPSKLVKLSGQNLQKTAEYLISATNHPQHLGISQDKGVVYFGGGFGYAGIYAMDINSSVAPSVPLIGGTKYFYGFDVNPFTGDIFALDAKDFTSAGTLVRYSPSGGLIREYSTGISPNGAVFK